MTVSWFKRYRRETRDQVLAALGMPCRTGALACHREQMYYRAFLDLKNHLGITEPFFPFGGAANGSLLYLLARVITNLPVSKVCELGCGQSTRLFDSLMGVRDFELTTLEHNDFWVSQIRAQLHHSDRIQLLSKPLEDRTVRGRPACFYDLASLEGKRFDLLLVDGPNGQKRRSRWGCLDLIDQHLEDDFLIIFDDAERRGEEDTYREAIRLLQAKRIAIHTSAIQAQKSQFLIATQKMRPACCF